MRNARAVFLCNRKNYRPVSRILFSGHHGPEPLPFIWRQASLPASALPTLPAGDDSHCRRATRIPKPGNRVYLAFQPARFIRPAYCYTAPCALTARFHPYPGNAGAVIFCDTLYVPAFGEPKAALHPLGGAALCVVRTFLPLPVRTRDTGDRAACSFTLARQN